MESGNTAGDHFAFEALPRQAEENDAVVLITH
jgi:hypothetical protein